MRSSLSSTRSTFHTLVVIPVTLSACACACDRNRDGFIDLASLKSTSVNLNDLTCPLTHKVGTLFGH